MRAGTLAAPAAAALAALATAGPVRADACADRFDAAFEARDVAAVAALLDRPAVREACVPGQLDHARRRATDWLARRADELAAGGDAAAAERLLDGAGGTGLLLAPSWRVNAVLGDVASLRDDWAEAAVQYGRAYELSVDEAERAGDAAAGTLARHGALFDRASEAVMLSGSLASAVSRSGEVSGILGTRGPKPRAVPVPIRFETGEDVFTAEGREAAAGLSRALLARDLETIELVGHADPRGDDADNLALSERRAAAVADAVGDAFVRAGRSPPRIVARGEGETCPARLSDSGRYTLAQRHSLHRRVEVVLDPSRPVPAPRCGEREAP